MLNSSRSRRRHVRRVATTLLLAFAITGCATRGGVPRPFPGAALPPGAVPDAPPVGEPASEPAAPPRTVEVPELRTPMATLIATAMSFRGTPYRNGGSDPSGFDCSGFVQWVYAQHGRALPREVRDQFRIGQDIDADDVEAGDLVFFETVSRGASHVGIALGGGEFIHAPSSRGVVRVERYTSSYWAPRWVGAKRVVEAQ